MFNSNVFVVISFLPSIVIVIVVVVVVVVAVVVIVYKMILHCLSVISFMSMKAF